VVSAVLELPRRIAPSDFPVLMSQATPPPPVGIDLGTTYSVVAYLDESGRPITVVNSEGDLITPSIVLFDGENVIVGKEAQKAMSTDATSVADCAKRDLGERIYRKILDGRQYPPEAIQAWVLNKLRNDAGRLLGDFRQVVITVPAYFDEVRRKSTQDAGYVAGFEVLDIINEPTAAALAYGYHRGFMNPDGGAVEPQKVLVYDLGGGTFDVTVMELDGQTFRALATDGDVRLGGRDWDQRLMDYVAEEFVRQHGVDPREDPNVNGRLWRECEDAKRTLAARSRTSLAIDYQGHALRTEVTRAKFEEITHDLLDRTRFTTRQTLLAAGLEWGQIDRVLMVGGSTRMPAVGEMLKQLSSMNPDNSVAVDEAVAHGAALHAGFLASKHRGERHKFRIKNVNSHSLGVVGTDPETRRRRNAPVIPRNTPLPVMARRSFKTQKANQQSILVQIVEGESRSPDECSQIGRCVVRDLPEGLPAGTPIDVCFKYEENGRLTVTVTVGENGLMLKHEITRDNSLTREQLDAWRQYICGLAPGEGPEPADAAADLASGRTT